MRVQFVRRHQRHFTREVLHWLHGRADVLQVGAVGVAIPQALAEPAAAAPPQAAANRKSTANTVCSSPPGSVPRAADSFQTRGILVRMERLQDAVRSASACTNRTAFATANAAVATHEFTLALLARRCTFERAPTLPCDGLNESMERASGENQNRGIVRHQKSGPEQHGGLREKHVFGGYCRRQTGREATRTIDSRGTVLKMQLFKMDEHSLVPAHAPHESLDKAAPNTNDTKGVLQKAKRLQGCPRRGGAEGGFCRGSIAPWCSRDPDSAFPQLGCEQPLHLQHALFEGNSSSPATEHKPWYTTILVITRSFTPR